MRVSNWVVMGGAFVLSVFLLWSWYANGFAKIDGPIDVIATLIWWLAIVGVIFAISYAEKERRRRLRTAFVTAGAVYNAEAGMVQVRDNDRTVDTLAAVMDNLSFGDSLDDPFGRTLPSFTKVVRTDRFDSARNVWSGEVVYADAGSNAPINFNSREELAELLIA